MNIDEIEAESLCRDIVESLVEWPSLTIALQSGGLEQKANGVIEAALKRVATSKGLMVLREYRHADFVTVSPSSTGMSRLSVNAVFELKFNYSKQVSEIRSRLTAAIHQANEYKSKFGAGRAFVIYLLLSPKSDSVPEVPRDSGWIYWNGDLAVGISVLRGSLGHNKILADWTYEDVQCDAYCALVVSEF